MRGVFAKGISEVTFCVVALCPLVTPIPHVLLYSEESVNLNNSLHDEWGVRIFRIDQLHEPLSQVVSINHFRK